ncbi:MAG: nuclear transport factor 2 family protein [Deltaproteobacteria bacterium]|nr:nuclear transport factor 2 family protein [Deltaproteobacteria bacterium]
MSDDSEVLLANEAFYSAFARRDLAAMDALWARHELACCIHPGWAALRQRDEIMASWRSIFSADDDADIRCTRVDARMHGATATIICEEHLGGAQLTATNAFVLKQGQWRIWHHHAGPIAHRVREATAGSLLN